jgi:hypothetical protein
MSLQTLKSAAHAAGYAMAAEDLPEPRPQSMPHVRPTRRSTALVVRTGRPVSIKFLRAKRYLRRMWQRDWLGAHWTGRAHA